jgi:hypothetical protein
MVVIRPPAMPGERRAQNQFGEGGMATNIKQIIYFHPRLDAAAAAIRSRRSDIDMFRRDFGGPVADTWAEMGRAHGYQPAPAEMREPWFPDGRLIARHRTCSPLLAGAGYDVIDVDACTKRGSLSATSRAKRRRWPSTPWASCSPSPRRSWDRPGDAEESNIERSGYIGTELLGRPSASSVSAISAPCAEICRTAFRMTVLAYDPTSRKMAARNAGRPI